MAPPAPESPLLRALSTLTPQELEDEVAAAQQAVTAAETYLSWVKLARNVAGQMNGATAKSAAGPEAPLVPVGPRPTLRRAILMVMSEKPGRWQKRDIYSRLSERGWLPEGQTPDKQLTNRLSEMVSRKELVRHKPGVFSAPRTDHAT